LDLSQDQKVKDKENCIILRVGVKRESAKRNSKLV
jgi:hypothetical protein